MRNFKSDQELVAALRGDNKETNCAILWILKKSGWRDSVGIQISKFSMDMSDRDEVFYECLAAFVMNIRNDSYEYKSALKTYFEGICRNNLKSRLTSKTKDASRYISMENEFLILKESIDQLSIQENERQIDIQQLLSRLIKRLGERCQQVLGYQKLGYSMREIGKILNIERQSVKNRSFECRKKLRAMAAGDSKLLAKIKALI
jgi:RNA polymerase sigma factor (sigma-70 family)